MGAFFQYHGQYLLISYLLASPIRVKTTEVLTKWQILVPRSRGYSAEALGTENQFLADFTMDHSALSFVEHSLLVLGGRCNQVSIVEP